MANILDEAQLRLSAISIGDIDAKNEILKQHGTDASVFMNGFFVPKNYDHEAVEAGQVMYIVGFKGTGKTSLLRWLGIRKHRDGHRVSFLLFKTHIKEEDRQAISRDIWFDYLPVKKAMTGINQDFKYAWQWIIIDKIFDLIARDRWVVTKTPKLEELAKIIGYDVGSGHSVLLKQHLSIMPRLSAGKVEISAKSPVIEGKLGFDIGKDKVVIPFGELVRAAVRGLCELTYTGKKVYFFVDELEAFSASAENFDRDIRMIRDLLVSVHDLNSEFRTRGVPIFVMAAVRSEVMSVVNRTGEEVGRTVDDFSFVIDWTRNEGRDTHQLIHLVRQKIKASEIAVYGRQKNMDPVKTYFPGEVDGVSIQQYLLNATMLRPRDLVRRLGLVKKREPASRQFSDDALRFTFGQYSDQLWQEVAEELVPDYAPDEVVDLEHALRGFYRFFYRRQFQETLLKASVARPALRELLTRATPEAVLKDFFRLGAIGNFYRGPTGRMMPRWAFRGDLDLDPERRMMFHRALWPHLALVQEQWADRPGEGTSGSADGRRERAARGRRP